MLTVTVPRGKAKLIDGKMHFRSIEGDPRNLVGRRTGRNGDTVFYHLTGLVHHISGVAWHEVSAQDRLARAAHDLVIETKSDRYYGPGIGHNRYDEAQRCLDICRRTPGITIEDYVARSGRLWALRKFAKFGTVKIVNSTGQDNAEVVEEQPAPEIAPAPAPTDYSEGDEVLPAVFDKIMNLAKIGQNIMLSGPAGSGKTFLSAKIAEKLGRPFAAQSCSAGMSESQLAGWLLPVGETGRFSYIASSFVRMYEEGGVFLFDEMDAADENTVIFINAALANGHFFLPQRHENPEVKRHKDFVAIAACNTMGLGESNIYSGRTQLDGATLDRFRAGVVTVDYDTRVESRLVDPEVLAWGRNIRKAIKKNELDRIMSTRVLLDFSLQKKELGYTQAEWEKSYFADWTKDEINMVRAERNGI